MPPQLETWGGESPPRFLRLCIGAGSEGGGGSRNSTLVDQSEQGTGERH